MDLKKQMEAGVRSLKYTVKYGAAFNVPNPIRRGKEEPVDTLMRRLYVMPVPKGSLTHTVGGFEEEEEDGEEEDEEDEARGGGSARGWGKGMSSSSDRGSRKDSEDSEGSKEKEEEDGEEEEEEDDGFGTMMNISAHRLPTEDNALTRFYRRALANNGEAAQITHLKNMDLGALAPRSDEEILETLDQGFYTESFDPALHMLESMPEEAASDFESYIAQQLSEKDVAKEHIMAKLATRVEANYHVLIEGMKNIQEVDLDLVSAGVQTVNSRRKLSVADNGMRLPMFKVLAKRARRENLQKVANIVKAATEVLSLEKEAVEAAKVGRYDKAVLAATDAKLALESDTLSNVNMMDATRQEFDRFLPALRLEVDRALRRLCAFKFSASEYSWILKSYLTLDDHGVRLNSRDVKSFSKLLPGPKPSESSGGVGGGSVEDILAEGLLPAPPAVDRGGILGLSDRLSRFLALEVEYCIKAAIAQTTVEAITTANNNLANNAASKLRQGGTGSALGSTTRGTAPSPTPLPQPEVVLDVNGRVWTFKGKKLLGAGGWTIPDLLKQLPPGQLMVLLSRVCEAATEVLHRHYLFTQWHRSPFDERNNDDAFLHRYNASEHKGEDSGELSEDEDEEDGDEEDSIGSSSNKKSKKEKKAGKEGGKKDDEEDEEDDEEDDDEEEDTGFDSDDERAERVNAEQQHRIYRERRERLERARLSAAAKSLKEARRRLWEGVEKTVLAIFKELGGDVSSMNVDDFVRVLGTGELLVALGEDFGKNESKDLRAMLRTKAKAFFDKTHQECFTVMRQMLDRETWLNVPISVDALGGIAGMIGSHTRALAWPAMNGSGHVIKDRLMRAARKRAGLDVGGGSKVESPGMGLGLKAPAADSNNNTHKSSQEAGQQQQQSWSILDNFHLKGNPFAPPTATTAPSPAPAKDASSKPQQPQQPPAVDSSLVIFDPTDGGLAPLSVTSSSNQWAITQAALNGFAKYTGRYVQVMSMAPAISLDVYTGLCELLEFYIYMVFTIFIPDQSGSLLLHLPSHFNTEASLSEEAGLVNHDVYIPLPCEHDELQLLKTFLQRIKDEMVEESSSLFPLPLPSIPVSVNVSQAATATVETASKMKQLGADAAKKFGAFASSATKTASSTALASAAGGGPAPSPPPPPVQQPPPPPQPHPQPQAHPPPQQQAGPMMQSPSHDPASPPQAPSKALIKKFKIVRPAMISEALEDADALYGLSQRAVALESCFLLIEMLKAVQPKVLPLLPKKAAFPGTRGSCEGYAAKVSEVVTQLRSYAYRCAAPKLIEAASVVRVVEGQKWDTNKLKEDPSAYTEDICATCRAVWEKVHGPESDDDQPRSRQQQQPGMGGGLDNMYIPPQVQMQIWTEVVQAAMGALLEAFARVEKCSTEGRALMSMDLQVVQLGLDDIQRVRPGRGKVYVDSYIKAFYYAGESDVMQWIQMNWKSYAFRHMVGLLNAGVGPKKKKKALKDLIVQVSGWYTGDASGGLHASGK